MKKLITILVIIGVGFGVYYLWPEKEIRGSLKADKSKILAQREKNGTVEYLYISDVEAKQKTKPQVSVDNELKNSSFKKSDFKNYIESPQEDLSQRTDHSTQFTIGTLKDGREVKQTHYYADFTFYNDRGTWYETGEATTTKSNFDREVNFLDKLKMFLVHPVIAGTYYVSGGDGFIRLNDGSWSTVYSGTTGDQMGSSAGEIQTGHNGSAYSVKKGLFPVNTSGSGTPASATFYLNNAITSDADNDGYDYVVVVSNTQADTSNLALADYGRVNKVEGSNELDLTGVGTGYIAFTLNATGLGWINTSGYTKLSVVEGHWLNNHAINTGVYNYISVYFSATAGTDYDPYLSITTASASSLQDYGLIFE
jgi:hypothetical protein